ARRRRRADPHLGRQDHQARRAHRDAGVRRRGGAARCPRDPAIAAASASQGRSVMVQLSPDGEIARPSFAQALAVYLRPRVLIVMFLGFSSGLPLALSGTTLQVWAKESHVDLTSIGLFTLVATPYVFKFAWAPLV